MKLTIKPYQLEFWHPFGVSSNTRKYTDTVFIRLELNGFAGYGEACLPPYLGETVEGTLRFLESARGILTGLTIDFDPARVMQVVDSLSHADNAAKASLDIALNDLKSKMLGVPFYDFAGIGKSEAMSTSFTIGIDSEQKLLQKLTEASDFSILKIKAGTSDDKRLIMQVRKFTTKPLYVDVNQGWKDRHHVLKMLNWMKDEGIAFVEQPMPVRMLEDMVEIKKVSPVNLIADESVKRFSDLEKCRAAFHGVNIKLMKCTGLTEALKMIEWAKQSGMKILLGCMAESSCGASAMAQLMKLADYIDLDSPKLYKNDPFEGISYRSGKVVLNDLPGTGTRPRPDFFE